MSSTSEASPAPAAHDRRTATAKQLAELYQVCVRTIHVWTRQGRLPPPLAISATRKRWDLDAVLAWTK
jgi:hypothetical protein